MDVLLKRESYVVKLIFNRRVNIESMEDSMDKQLVDQIVVRENQLDNCGPMQFLGIGKEGTKCIGIEIKNHS